MSRIRDFRIISLNIIISLTFILLLSTATMFAQLPLLTTEVTPHFSGGLSIGYDIGMPIQANLMIKNLAEELPLTFRLFAGNSFLLDPGNAGEVRRVFINENTGGVPEKSASRWTFGFDLMRPINFLSMKKAYIVAGIRYSRFTGTFDYVGGDELFDVHANQIGLGAGLDSYFKIATRVDLVFSIGADYYFPGTLEGHDAAYSPDGTIVNQREQFTYADADQAVNQPKFLPRLAIGFNYGF